MPRRRSRFSDLERQFRESGGVAAPGSRLAGYIDFKKGINKIDVNKILTAAERKRHGVALLPFGLGVPATPAASGRYLAAITKYSNDTRLELGLTNNKCGYDNISPATQKDNDYYPALLKVFLPSGPAVNVPSSGVTKKGYKRIPGKSASIPFGRTVTDVIDQTTGTAPASLDAVDIEDVKAALALKAKEGTGTIKASSVSFVPEEFKSGSSALPPLP